MKELLQHLREMLEELADTRETLSELEALFQAFAKVQHAAKTERDKLRAELAKELLRASEVRVIQAECDVVGSLLYKAWKKAMLDNCLEYGSEDSTLEFRAKRLGWVERVVVTPEAFPPVKPP